MRKLVTKSDRLSVQTELLNSFSKGYKMRCPSINTYSGEGQFIFIKNGFLKIFSKKIHAAP
jgi:hypothetical protein